MPHVRSQNHNTDRPWNGDLVIDPRKFALYLGLGAGTEPHSMHVIQLFILIDGEMHVHLWDKCRFPLRGEFQLEGESIIELVPGQALLIPPDYPIQLEGHGNLAIFFLNPEVADGEDGPPTHHLRCDLTVFLPEAVQKLLPQLNRYLTNRYSSKEITSLCTELIELIISIGKRESLYWLVQRTLRCLFEAFDNDENSSITTIRKCIDPLGNSLDEFQIQREFGKHIGIAIRRFSIALRLWDAVEEMAYRKNLDDVCSAVNLAKGMLSRYFKRVIGISPSEIHRKGNVLILT